MKHLPPLGTYFLLGFPKPEAVKAERRRRAAHRMEYPDKPRAWRSANDLPPGFQHMGIAWFEGLALDSPDGWLPVFRLESTDQLFFEHPSGACFEIKVVTGQ